MINASYTGDPEGDMVDANDNQDGDNDDSIDAGAGDDTIYAGDGDDTVRADEGDDVVCVTVYSVGGGVVPGVPPPVPPEVPPLLPPLVPPKDDPAAWETVAPPPPPPPPHAAKVNIITRDTQNRTIKPMHHETKTTR